MAVKDKSYDVRYFTYYLTFPDGETWVRQKPFIHNLQFELGNLKSDLGLGFDWRMRAHDLLRKGEVTWRDKNSVEHRIVIENSQRPERWGTKK